MTSVSLCIPVYRSAEFLPDLFERLRALEPKPAEILLLDDASPDQSATLISNFAKQPLPQLNLRLIRNTSNTGIAAAYNRLAQEARAEWVHILDADDYPVEVDFYARVATELDPQRDVVVTALDSNSQVLRWGVSAFIWMAPRYPPRWWPLLGSFATRAGVIYRRERLLAQPFPDPAFPGSDVLHLLRLRGDHNCVFLRRAHVFYHVHAAATSSRERSYREYRAGLAQFGWVTWLAHMLDLRLRMLGQRIGRRRP
ncbi:MAG: glycosyltransferase family 2 protein [Casimicrobiaceae bacterium]